MTSRLLRPRRRAVGFLLATALPLSAPAVAVAHASALPPAAAGAPSALAPSAQPLALTAPRITSAAPVAAVVGSPYTHTFTATGDPAPTWSVTSGSLPPGLSLDASTGVLSGVPTAVVSVSLVRVTATNAAGSASQLVTLITALGTGGGSGGGTGGTGGTGGSNATVPALTSAAPPSAVVGAPYAHTFTATGAPAPTWSLTSGSLPPGLTLNPATGLLSGTPTAAGAWSSTVTATNSAGSAAQALTLVTVTAATAPAITSAPPLAGTAGTVYVHQFHATGTPAATWSLSAGTLPAGLSLNPTTGVLSGTPATAADATFTVTATNSAGNAGQQVSVRIADAGAAPVITSGPVVSATVGQALNAVVSATGNPAPTWAVTGTLPAGLSLNPTTGVISGTPTAAGTTTLGLTATNASGTGTATLQLLVHPAQTAATPGAGSDRYAGADRKATAIAVSQELFPIADSTRAVVVTTSEKYADALAGGRLASADGAPLLLTHPTTLDAAVGAEVHRVLAAGGTVYALGGPDTLAPQVLNALQALDPSYRVVRLAGADRYETALQIADAVDATTTSGGAAGGPVYLVNGRNFPDGLTVSALAARTGGVVLLTDEQTLPAATRTYLSAQDPTGVRTVPVGGAAATAAATLPAAAARAAALNALVGVDRYDTARLLAARFDTGAAAPVAAVGLATGENWPDALVGGAAMGALNSPLLLTPRDWLHDFSQSAMATLNETGPVRAGLVFGGENSISPATAASFAAMVPTVAGS